MRGRVARDLGEVRITLVSASGRPIGTSAIDPTGFARAGMIPFEATFSILTSRPPTEPLAVFVVPVDGAGQPLDGVRRPYVASSVLEIGGPAAEVIVSTR